MIWRFPESTAIRHLQHGNVIVHATEGVFGLGCRAYDQRACARVAVLKGRRTRPFIVVVSDFAQIVTAVDVAQVDFALICASWPGPETWILPAARTAPRWLCGDNCTIAVRVTGHVQFARLCAVAGPMVSTSANQPGRKPAQNLLQARNYFGATVDFYLNGALETPGRPTRIRDATSGLALRS